MSVLHQPWTVWTLAILVAFAVISCGESRTSQCNRLSTVVNQAAADAQAVGSDPKADQFSDLAKAATKLDQHAKTLQGLQMSDPQLKAYQGRFVEMYQETSQSIQGLVTAYQKRDVKAGNEAIQALQRSTSREEPLVREVNQYCTGS